MKYMFAKWIIRLITSKKLTKFVDKVFYDHNQRFQIWRCNLSQTGYKKDSL